MNSLNQYLNFNIANKAQAGCSFILRTKLQNAMNLWVNFLGPARGSRGPGKHSGKPSAARDDRVSCIQGEYGLCERTELLRWNFRLGFCTYSSEGLFQARGLLRFYLFSTALKILCKSNEGIETYDDFWCFNTRFIKYKMKFIVCTDV